MTPYHFFTTADKTATDQAQAGTADVSMRANVKVVRGYIAVALFAILVLASASAVFEQSTPYVFTRQGLFDCSAGEFSSSVGALAATGGAYVPVNDAAVTINTYQIL